MSIFKVLYLELSELITTQIPEIQWCDLWNSQVYNLENEHPFPAPAVFLAFRSNRVEDTGVKTQNVQLQVDVFLFYETFADTYSGAFNQTEALQFLDMLDSINKLLHASTGNSYSNMKRVSFSPIDTGGAGNLYNIMYNCEIMDYTAVKEWDQGKFSDLQIDPNIDNKYVV